MLGSKDDWFAAIDGRSHELVKSNLQKYGRSTDKDGRTGLMHAVANRDVDMVKILAYTEHSMTDPDGQTAIMMAALSNQGEICKRLISYEMASRDPEGRTPLMLAAKHSCMDAIIYLLPYQKTIQDNRGRTALMYAAEAGHLDVVKYLAIREREIVSHNNETALILAANAGYADVANYLRQFESNTLPGITSQSLQNLSNMSLNGSIQMGGGDLVSSLQAIDMFRNATSPGPVFGNASKTQLEKDLEAKILSLEQKLVTLHEESSSIYSDNVALQDQIKRLKQTLSEYKEKIDSLHATVEDSMATSSALRDTSRLANTNESMRNNLELSGLSSSTTLKDATVQKLEADLAAAQAELNRLREETAKGADTRVKNLEDENERLRELVTNAKEQEATIAEYAKRDEEIVQLRNLLNTSEQENSRRMAELEEELARTKERLKESEEQLEILSSAKPPREVEEQLRRDLAEREREIDELKKTVKAQEAEIARLQDALHAACDAAEADALRTENESLRNMLAKVAESDSAEDALREELDRLRALVISRGIEIANMDRKLAESEKEYNRLLGELNRVLAEVKDDDSAQVRNLRAELRAKEEQISELRDLLSTQSQTVDSTREADLLAEVDALKKELRNKRDEADKLRGLVDYEEDDRLRTLEATVQDLEERLAQKEKDVVDLTRALQAAQNAQPLADGEDTRRLREEVETYVKRISALERLVEARDDAIQQLNLRLNKTGDAAEAPAAAAMYGADIQDINVLKSTIVKLEDIIRDKDRELDDLQQKLDDALNEVKYLPDDGSGRIHVLEKDKEALNTHNMFLQNMIKEKEAEIERLRASNSAADQAALKQQLSATEEELNELKEELFKTKEQLATQSDAPVAFAMEAAPASDDLIRALRSDIDVLKAHVVEKTQEIKELNKELLDKDDVIEELKDKLAFADSGDIVPSERPVETDLRDDEAVLKKISDANQGSNAELILRIAELEMEVEMLKEDLDLREEEVERLAEAIMHQERSFTHLREASIAKSGVEKSLRDALTNSTANSVLSASETGAHAMDELHGDLLKKHEMEVAALKKKLDDGDAKSKEKDEIILAMGKDLEQLKADVTEKREELDTMRQALRERETMIENLRADANNTREDHYRALEDENSKLRKHFDGLTSDEIQLYKKYGLLAKLREQHKEAEAELSDLELELTPEERARKEASLASLTDDIIRLQEELKLIDRPTKSPEEYARLLNEAEAHQRDLTEIVRNRDALPKDLISVRQQTNEYKALLKNKDLEIERLRVLLQESLENQGIKEDENNRLRKIISDMQAALVNSEDQIQRLKEDAVNASQHDRLLLDKLQSKEAEVENLKKSLEESLAGGSADAQAVQSLRDQVSELENSLAALRDELSRKNEELARIPTDITATIKRLQDAENECEKLKVQYNTAIKERDILHAKLRKFCDENGIANPDSAVFLADVSSIDDLSRKVRELEEDNKRLMAEMINSDVKKRRAVVEMSQAITDLDDLNASYSEHLKSLNEKYGANSMSLPDDSLSKSQIIDLTSKLRDLEVSLANEKDKVNGMNINNDVLKRKLDALERAVRSPVITSPTVVSPNSIADNSREAYNAIGAVGTVSDISKWKKD
ncbi:Chromosome segregation protein SMC/ coiled-coil protein [Giardia duodenalis assemblage B]|uniref:Chromosome segregation protein SMC/ coiled-coil protein n=1 Tax=Giardia duodenalis assemblage B TaxID=1394984 RepID=A0A132NMY2_GIAIN|nr:Chromosome segregation protein SMC/ coiled-coil protein [Giardia intestinalis assemblage B]